MLLYGGEFAKLHCYLGGGGGGGITGASGLEPDKYSLRALHILLYMVR